ncbi:MAG: hypothetical protein KAG26_08640 [Methylococcales bacterium]|nr:hypothetical protein [Methylococcales bacterium]
MTIELMSKEQYEKLLKIQKETPLLTYQNDGYDYIKGEWTDADKKAKKDIENILSKHIKGFSSFTNFRAEKGPIQLRIQYNYNWDGGMPFTGVGYIFLDELLNGFD